MTTQILANAQVTKLREYSKSYGAPETIEVSFIKVFEKEIQLYNSIGMHIRTMRKETKLLISFTGTSVTEEQFSNEVEANRKAWDEKREAKRIEDEKKFAAAKKICAEQLEAWKNFLIANPEKISKYVSAVKEKSSKKWRPWLRMKAANKVNNGKFEGFMPSPAELKDVLYSL